MQYKVVAMTVHKASNVDGAAKNLQILKHGCFTYIFNQAAQKISTITIAVTSSVSDVFHEVTVTLAFDDQIIICSF